MALIARYERSENDYVWVGQIENLWPFEQLEATAIKREIRAAWDKMVLRKSKEKVPQKQETTSLLEKGVSE